MVLTEVLTPGSETGGKVGEGARLDQGHHRPDNHGATSGCGRQSKPPQLAAPFMSGSASRSVPLHRLDAWGAALLGSSAIRTKMASKAKPGACLAVPVQDAVVGVDLPVTVKSTLSVSNTDVAPACVAAS
jgi:hypothetical protein